MTPGFDYDVEWLTDTLMVPVLPDDSIVAVDTETSGLFVDDGARVSVVSIAWWAHTPKAPMSDEPREVYSLVYPFDHGFTTPLGEKLLDPHDFKKSQRKNLTPGLFDDEYTAPNLPPDDYLVLLEWLYRHSLVYQNCKFDCHITATGLRGQESYLPGSPLHPDLSECVVWDTQVVNPVIWPEFPTSLKPTAQRLWGVEETQPQRDLTKYLKTNGMRFDLAPWYLLEPYAAQDGELTLRLYEKHLQIIEAEEVGPAQTVQEVCERETDLAVCLYRMERRGVGYDRATSLREAERLQRQADEAEQKFRQIVQYELSAYYPTINKVPPLTDANTRAFWFNKADQIPPGLHLKIIKETPEGAPSIAKDVIELMIKKDVPGAREYQRHNQCSTSAGMWYTAWAKAVGPPEPTHHPLPVKPTKAKKAALVRVPRLRTNYRQSRTQSDRGNQYSDQGGTISGRIAVERIQLQAIPHDYQLPELDPPLTTVRGLFIPDPGFELWELDLSQAEYRVAAGISKCKRMITAIEAGGWDAHNSTTELMFNITQSDSTWKFKRNVSKRLNFGMIYGAGANTIQQQIFIYTGEWVELDDLQEWLDLFRKTYPELGRAARAAEREAMFRHSVKLAGGRERWFSPYEPTHKAFNAKIQGGVAEMMKVAMIDIEANHPGFMLLQIHDSIILELPKSEAADIVEDCVQRLTAPFTREFGVTFVADAKEWH